MMFAVYKRIDMVNQKKILLARTDRLGDLVLTTPAIKAIRKAYPDAYIAMVVRPYAYLVVKDNPYLDEVILYDKYGEHRSFIATIRFGMYIRRRGFDRAVIFHPTNRMHIIAYIANIPRRIGYDNKLKFLLTDKIKNTKHEGAKHEKDYTLDTLKPLGIEIAENELLVPVDDISKKQAEDILARHGFKKSDKIIAIHPGASCASKIWPSERFAKLSDLLITRHNVKIIILGGNDKRDMLCVDVLKKFMQNKAIFLNGILDITQLAAVLQKAVVFISNDSGPVHVATAIGTPVVDIFGRAQPGLSPSRWGPLGLKDIVIHKDVNCRDKCLAHNCKKSFACIRAISVDDVYNAILAMKLF
jgi:heptosyltransferase II